MFDVNLSKLKAKWNGRNLWYRSELYCDGEHTYLVMQEQFNLSEITLPVCWYRKKPRTLTGTDLNKWIQNNFPMFELYKTFQWGDFILTIDGIEHSAHSTYGKAFNTMVGLASPKLRIAK